MCEGEVGSRSGGVGLCARPPGKPTRDFGTVCSVEAQVEGVLRRPPAEVLKRVQVVLWARVVHGCALLLWQRTLVYIVGLW